MLSQSTLPSSFANSRSIQHLPIQFLWTRLALDLHSVVHVLPSAWSAVTYISCLSKSYSHSRVSSNSTSHLQSTSISSRVCSSFSTCLISLFTWASQPCVDGVKGESMWGRRGRWGVMHMEMLSRWAPWGHAGFFKDVTSVEGFCFRVLTLICWVLHLRGISVMESN